MQAFNGCERLYTLPSSNMCYKLDSVLSYYAFNTLSIFIDFLQINL